MIAGNGYFSADQELEEFWLKRSFLLHESFCSQEILKSGNIENDTCFYDINICKEILNVTAVKKCPAVKIFPVISRKESYQSLLF